MSQTITVPVENLHPNPDNPRLEAGDVSELAESIRRHGIKTDILVRPAPEFGDDHYMIEDGYRRWVAARHLLDFETLQVKVSIPRPGEDLAIREVVTSLITTLHRQDLGPMERARAYGRLRDEAHMTQQEIATLMGFKSDSPVSRSLSLLELSPSYQKAVERGTTSVSRALQAIGQKRAKERVKQGQKPANVEWEPEHFTNKHPLAKQARTMCDTRGHTNRRRLDRVACGQCWETVIRQDEAKVVQVGYKNAGIEVPWMPAWPIGTFSENGGNGHTPVAGQGGGGAFPKSASPSGPDF